MFLLSLFRRRAPKKRMAQELTCQTESEQRLFQEYQICLEQISRLESNIWQTAGFLGIGSVVGLVSLIGDGADTLAPFGVILAAAVFAINASLVWLRFVRRWGSIQSLKFERMREIEEKIGFKQGALVEERNEEAMGQKLYLRRSGSRPQRWLTRIFYRLHFSPSKVDDLIRRYEEKDEDERRSVESYEYRGNQPVCKLLVTTNILLWGLSAGYAAYRIPSTHTVSNMVIALVALLALIVVDIVYWRQR